MIRNQLQDIARHKLKPQGGRKFLTPNTFKQKGKKSGFLSMDLSLTNRSHLPPTEDRPCLQKPEENNRPKSSVHNHILLSEGNCTKARQIRQSPIFSTPSYQKITPEFKSEIQERIFHGDVGVARARCHGQCRAQRCGVQSLRAPKGEGRLFVR